MGVGVIDFNHSGRRLSVKADYGVVEIGLDEVVVCGVVGQLPGTHGVGIECVANIQAQMSLRIYVDEDIACLITAV